jgi:hypothetical protein
MELKVSCLKVRSRGAASVEAVVVLPVFVILFVSMFFVRDLTYAKLAADQEARRCAWLYSANDCSTVPIGCEGVVQGTRRGAINPDVNSAIGDAEKALSEGVSGNGLGAVKQVLQNLVIDALAQAFTLSLDSQKLVEQERPRLFGGGKSQITGTYRLACNIRKQGNDDTATAVWHQFRP